MLRASLFVFLASIVVAACGTPKGGKLMTDTPALPYRAPDIEELSGVPDDEPEPTPPVDEPKPEPKAEATPAPTAPPTAAKPAAPAAKPAGTGAAPAKK